MGTCDTFVLSWRYSAHLIVWGTSYLSSLHILSTWSYTNITQKFFPSPCVQIGELQTISRTQFVAVLYFQFFMMYCQETKSYRKCSYGTMWRKCRPYVPGSLIVNVYFINCRKIQNFRSSNQVSWKSVEWLQWFLNKECRRKNPQGSQSLCGPEVRHSDVSQVCYCCENTLASEM